MSDRPTNLSSRYDEVIAALAQIEARIAGVRQMVEHNAQQDAHLREVLVAWGRMNKRTRARFRKEHGFVQADAERRSK